MFASGRPYHQLISKNDMIPTPSQPINNWNMLLAEVRMIIVIRNSSRYLMNLFKCGSECIYHDENSIMDHVTNRATGRNSIKKKSNLKLIEIFRVLMVIRWKLEIIISVLCRIRWVSGMRLIRNEYLMIAVT